jgi:hypothetical protein
LQELYSPKTVPTLEIVEAQLHLKQISIIKTVKVPTHSVNDKHPNEDNKETIHKIYKVKDND